jgi:hypothetical protein
MHGGLDTKHSHRVERCEATKPRRAQDDDDDDDNPCGVLDVCAQARAGAIFFHARRLYLGFTNDLISTKVMT